MVLESFAPTAIYRDKKRDLSTRAPKRAGISKESKWEKQEAAKKKEMIASSKRKKKRAAGEGQVIGIDNLMIPTFSLMEFNISVPHRIHTLNAHCSRTNCLYFRR